MGCTRIFAADDPFVHQHLILAGGSNYHGHCFLHARAVKLIKTITYLSNQLVDNAAGVRLLLLK